MSSISIKKSLDKSDISILAENLLYLMHKFKIDSSELSKKTGIALTTINGLKRGAGNPTLSTLYQLSEFFDVTVGHLTEIDLSNTNIASQITYEIPLLTLNELEDFLHNRSKFKNTISTDLESDNYERFYAIKITNNTMHPFFEKGSIFVITNDNNIYDGDMVIVKFDKHPPCFRKVFIEGKSYFFKPISDLINDNISKTTDFNILGVVIKAIQHFHN